MPVFNFPTGTIVPDASPTVPTNWVECDGLSYNGADARYAALWSVIGNTYGGSGQSDFRVPNLGSRVPVGPKSSSEVAITNPSFATNTTGWTATNSTITRDTSTFDSSPASGRWDNTGASNNVDFGDQLNCALTGTFKAGVSYTVTWKMRANSPTNAWLYAYLGDLSSASNFQFTDFINGFTAGVWNTYSASWVPSTNTNGATFRLDDRSSFFGGSSYYWIDSLVVTSTEGDGGLGTWYGSTGHILLASQTGIKYHNHNITFPATGHSHGGSAAGTFADHVHAFYVTAQSIDNKNTNASVNAFIGSSNMFTTQTNSLSGGSGNTGPSSSGGWTVSNSTASNASSAHSNIQPELALNYIIKL